MKNLTLTLLACAALLLGGLYVRQSLQAHKAETTKEVLQQKVSELQSSASEQEQQAARLREQVDQARDDAAAKNAEAAQIRTALQQKNRTATAEAPAQDNPKPSNPLAEMFKNPEMKELIKNQQKTVLGGMIDKNYAKLFSNMHLTPEQSSSLKDMLLNKQLGAADIGMSMLSGDLDPAKRTELTQQVKASTDAADAEIKHFLGDDNFAQLQEYEKTMAERTSVSGLKDQLGSGPTALSDGQEQQLIQAMSDERQKFKFTTDLSDKSKFTGDFATMFTEDKMTGYLQELGQLNQQYLARAQGILSPEQYSTFEKYLNSQQALQKMGIQMAAKMFAAPKPAGN